MNLRRNEIISPKNFLAPHWIIRDLYLGIYDFLHRDCCIKANRCVAFGIRLRSHTEVCSLQTLPSAPCASSFLQSQDNLASKIVRLLTFATVSHREVEFTIYNKVSAMDWLLAVSCWLLAIGTIGAIRVIGSLTSNF